MPDTKQVTAQYRYVDLESLWPDFELQAMVADVLRRRARSGSGKRMFEDVSSRKIDLDQDGSFVVLNKISDPDSWNGHFLCGQLIHVKAGVEVPGITESLDAEIPELVLQNLHLGDQAKIVEGILYFALSGNHLCVVEGQRTKTRTLERYLTRLLQDAGELEPGKLVTLNAKLQMRSGLQEIEEISITPRPFKKHEEGEEEEVVARRAAEEELRGATVEEVLRVLGWSDEEIRDLEENVPPGGWMEGVFRLLFKRKGGRKAKVPRAQLERALRHLDPHSLGLLGDGGARERGGLVKLSKKIRIRTIEELLDPEDTMQQLMDTLRAWARQGKIDCNFG